MKLTELIADAKRTLDEFGDIPVVVPDSGCSCCTTPTYDPAGTSIERGGTAYNTETGDYSAVPVAFVVS